MPKCSSADTRQTPFKRLTGCYLCGGTEALSRVTGRCRSCWEKAAEKDTDDRQEQPNVTNFRTKVSEDPIKS